MKSANYLIILVLLISVLPACQISAENINQSQNSTVNSSNSSSNSANNSSSVSNPPSSSPSPVKTATPKQTTDSSEGLTKEKVEAAVNKLLSDFRLSGSVSVKGIQELQQQNATVADLEFEQFEYPVTTEGKIIKARDFKPKQMPKDGSRLPTVDEMFPPRRVVYSKSGKATLARYNDGRWVLKEIRWGFDTGVKGNVEIR